MFARASFIAVAVTLASSVFAQVEPTEPFGDSVYREGGTCNIEWNADPTGQWTTTNIQLMTGDNFNMVHLTTIATVDGTQADNNTYSYPCPNVTPNSKIYFYQFTSPASAEVLWTTRFTIADAEGNTTPPPNATQPGTGDAIPWGVGALEDPSTAVPPPVRGSGSASGTVSATRSATSASERPSASAGAGGANAAPGDDTPSSRSSSRTASATASPSASANGASIVSASGFVLAGATLFGLTGLF